MELGLFDIDVLFIECARWVDGWASRRLWSTYS